MSNLTYNGIEYNILYIDSTIGTSGDGSTPATALANIPSPLVDKTCYIIRRSEDNETQFVDMPQSWYESLYDIMFLGMPTPNSPLWDLMEESAKTAWGSDTGKWARIRCNMSSYFSGYNSSISGVAINDTRNMIVFKSSTVRSFIADTCYFYRDGESGTAGQYGLYLNWMFAIETSNANISFNNCKFGYTQYNLEDDNYITNEDISTDQITYPQFKCKGYVYIRNANCVTFNNCIINHVHNNGSMSYFDSSYVGNAGNKTIVIQGSKKIVFTNNQYNILYRNSYDSTNNYDQYNAISFVGMYNSSSYNIYYDDYLNSEYILSNLEINKIFTQTNARYGGRDIAFRAIKGSAENIKYNFKVMGGGSVESIAQYNSYPSIYLLGLNSLKVNDVICDYTTSNISSMNVLSLETLRTNAGNLSSKIENIFIKMNPNSGFNIGNPLLTMNAQRNEYRSASEWENSNYLSEIQNDTKAWIAKNVVVDAQHYYGNVLSATRCGIKSPYIKGHITLASSTLDVDKIYNYYPTSYGVTLTGNSYLKCNEYWADLDHPSYTGQKQLSIEYDSLSSVYVYKTNSIIFDENPTYNNYEGSVNTSFVCPNYILDGQFFARTANNFAKSWNVLRSGTTAQGSLRFNNNYSAITNFSNPVVVGQEPYKGIQIVPTTTGKKILTAYFACKNFDDSEFKYGRSKLSFDVNTTEVKTDFFDSEKTYNINHTYSSTSYAWQNDNSTWSNDTNLVAYKVEIPFEVFTTEEPIDIKIWFNWYSVNGVVYVDPDFKIRDVA